MADIHDSSEPKDPAEAGHGSLDRRDFFKGAALGAAGLVVGAILGGLALGQEKSVRDACTNGVCPIEKQDGADAAKAKALGADICFGIGGAVAITGLVLLIVSVTGSSSDGSGAIASRGRPRARSAYVTTRETISTTSACVSGSPCATAVGARRPTTNPPASAATAPTATALARDVPFRMCARL